MTVKYASEVERAPSTPIWPGYLNEKTLTVLMGEPGTGKSSMMRYVVARLSRGEALPDGYQAPGAQPVGCVWITNEEAESVLAEDLELAGVDLGKVRFMGYVQPPKVGGLDAPLRRFDASQKEDLALLKETIQDAYQDNIKLTVIDTARGASSKSISGPKAAREMLEGLQQIAEETGTCILLLHHTNRRSSRSAYEKIAGSAEMYSYPRCVLSVAPHDTDPSKISLVVPKAYRCSAPPPLTYMRNESGAIEFISGQRPEAAAEYAMQDAVKLGDMIVAFLDEHAPARFSVQQLCCSSKRSYDAVAKSAQRLAQAGKIANPVYGFYQSCAAQLDKNVQLPAAAAAAPVTSDEKTLVLAPTNGHSKVDHAAETVLMDVLP